MTDKDATVETNPLPKSWPKQLAGAPRSLRVFEHLDEIYLNSDQFSVGDYAEVTRSHCTSAESGLLVKIVNKLNWHIETCADCGQHMREYWLEVEPLDPAVLAKWQSQAPGGPWSYPMAWLRKVNLSAR